MFFSAREGQKRSGQTVNIRVHREDEVWGGGGKFPFQLSLLKTDVLIKSINKTPRNEKIAVQLSHRAAQSVWSAIWALVPMGEGNSAKSPSPQLQFSPSGDPSNTGWPVPAEKLNRSACNCHRSTRSIGQMSHSMSCDHVWPPDFHVDGRQDNLSQASLCYEDIIQL